LSATWDEQTSAVCFIGVGGVAFFVFHLIRVRLALRHPVLFARLGKPNFRDSNLEAKYWDFQKFVLWGYLSVKDPVLATLCLTATLSSVVGIMCFVLCIV
jgi:hypothetical protein